MKNFLYNFIDENYEDNKIRKGRLKFIFSILIIIFFILAFRLIYISVYFKKNGDRFQLSVINDLQGRGNIVDRNGVILASDIELVNFYLNRELISNPKKTASIISKIIPEINEEKLYEKLISTKNKAKYIFRQKAFISL